MCGSVRATGVLKASAVAVSPVELLLCTVLRSAQTVPQLDVQQWCQQQFVPQKVWRHRHLRCLRLLFSSAQSSAWLNPYRRRSAAVWSTAGEEAGRNRGCSSQHPLVQGVLGGSQQATSMGTGVGCIARVVRTLLLSVDSRRVWRRKCSGGRDGVHAKVLLFIDHTKARAGPPSSTHVESLRGSCLVDWYTMCVGLVGCMLCTASRPRCPP